MGVSLDWARFEVIAQMGVSDVNRATKIMSLATPWVS